MHDRTAFLSAGGLDHVLSSTCIHGCCMHFGESAGPSSRHVGRCVWSPRMLVRHIMVTLTFAGLSQPVLDADSSGPRKIHLAY